MKRMYQFLRKNYILIICGVLLLPFPVALLTMLLSYLFAMTSIPISSSEVFAFYGTAFSILFTLIGVVATIELALKDKADKENADTIPVLALEPIPTPTEPSGRLLIASSSVEVVNEAVGNRTDSFLLSNFGQQTAINVFVHLEDVQLLLGSIKPMESKTISFNFSDDLQESKSYNLSFRCRTVRGEIIDYTNHLSVDVDGGKVSSISLLLLPIIRPIVADSSVSVMRKSWFNRIPRNKIILQKQDSTKQEIFK